jgi:hypothetical protein
MCSTQANNNSRKLQLRCGCQFPWCVLTLRVDEHLFEEVRVTSGVLQGSVLGPLLFPAYVNDIWRDTDSNIWPFIDDCMIYRKILDSSDIGKLQTDLNRLREGATENEMKINPDKVKW